MAVSLVDVGTFRLLSGERAYLRGGQIGDLSAPAAVGGHTGLEGAFQLFDLGQGSELLYTEDRCSVAFFEQEQHIAPARQAFRRLCEVACSPQDSLDLITSIADELARDCGEAGRGDGASQVAEEQPQLEVGMR